MGEMKAGKSKRPICAGIQIKWRMEKKHSQRKSISSVILAHWIIKFERSGLCSEDTPIFYTEYPEIRREETSQQNLLLQFTSFLFPPVSPSLNLIHSVICI